MPYSFFHFFPNLLESYIIKNKQKNFHSEIHKKKQPIIKQSKRKENNSITNKKKIKILQTFFYYKEREVRRYISLNITSARLQQKKTLHKNVLCTNYGQEKAKLPISRYKNCTTEIKQQKKQYICQEWLYSLPYYFPVIRRARNPE